MDPNHWLNVGKDQQLVDDDGRNANFNRKKTTYKFSSSSKFKIKAIRPFSESKRDFKSRTNFQWDVNHRIGESGKHLKKQVMKRMEDYQADCTKRYNSDNEALQLTMKNHKLIEKSFHRKVNNFFDDPEVLNDPKNYENNIIAKKSFFLNPQRNEPKIIRTKNKLYVV